MKVKIRRMTRYLKGQLLAHDGSDGLLENGQLDGNYQTMEVWAKASKEAPAYRGVFVVLRGQCHPLDLVGQAADGKFVRRSVASRDFPWNEDAVRLAILDHGHKSGVNVPKKQSHFAQDAWNAAQKAEDYRGGMDLHDEPADLRRMRKDMEREMGRERP